MKKIFHFFVLALVLVACASCSNDNDPFITADANDYPRILNSEFSTEQPGGMFTFANITRNQNFDLDIVVTPADYTTVNWYLDGEKVFEGKHINMPILAGTYNAKIEATTVAGKSTYRNGYVVVRALEGDPIVGDDAAARLLVAGKQANLSGTDLDKVAKISIDGKQAAATYSGSQLQFITPSVADGQYRLVLIDANGQQYGGGFITVTSNPYVLESQVTAKANSDVTFTGINLDKVSKVTIGNAVATIKSAEYGTLVVTLPQLANGDYELSATAANGSAVSFGGSDKCAVSIISATVLFEGSQPVPEWTAQDFGGLCAKVQDMVNAGTIKEGTSMTIDFDITATDYCSIVLLGNDWRGVLTGASDPNRGDLHPAMTDKTVTVQIPACGIDVIKTNGFYLTGHGYTIKKVSVE